MKNLKTLKQQKKQISKQVDQGVKKLARLAEALAKHTERHNKKVAKVEKQYKASAVKLDAVNKKIEALTTTPPAPAAPEAK